MYWVKHMLGSGIGLGAVCRMVDAPGCGLRPGFGNGLRVGGGLRIGCGIGLKPDVVGATVVMVMIMVIIVVVVLLRVYTLAILGRHCFKTGAPVCGFILRVRWVYWVKHMLGSGIGHWVKHMLGSGIGLGAVCSMVNVLGCFFFFFLTKDGFLHYKNAWQSPHSYVLPRPDPKVWGVKNKNRIVYIKFNICSPEGVFRKKFQKRKRKRKRKEKKKKIFQFLNRHKTRVQVVSNPPTLQNYIQKWSPKGKENKICK